MINLLSPVKNVQIVQYLTRKCVLIFFLKGKKFFFSIKAPAGFELITCRFVGNALNHYATLIENFEKEKCYKTMLDTSQPGGIPYHLRKSN